MKADNYLDCIADDDLNGNKRFKSYGEQSVELVAPQALLDLLPAWESKNQWEVDIVVDDNGEGIFESEKETLDEYGVKSIDEINAHFARRFYDVSLDDEEYGCRQKKSLRVKLVILLSKLELTMVRQQHH